MADAVHTVHSAGGAIQASVARSYRSQPGVVRPLPVRGALRAVGAAIAGPGPESQGSRAARWIGPAASRLRRGALELGGSRRLRLCSCTGECAAGSRAPGGPRDPPTARAARPGRAGCTSALRRDLRDAEGLDRQQGRCSAPRTDPQRSRPAPGPGQRPGQRGRRRRIGVFGRVRARRLSARRGAPSPPCVSRGGSVAPAASVAKKSAYLSDAGGALGRHCGACNR